MYKHAKVWYNGTMTSTYNMLVMFEQSFNIEME